jgi:protein-tyrosine-phosphatase
MKDFLKRRNIDYIEVSSAGTNANSDTSKLHRTHFDRMKELGINASAFTRTQCDENLLKNADLIIGMAQEHQDFVSEKYRFHIPLYNELVCNKKTSIVVSNLDSDEDIPQQITNMTNHIYASTPILLEYIIKHL